MCVSIPLHLCGCVCVLSLTTCYSRAFLSCPFLVRLHGSTTKENDAHDSYSWASVGCLVKPRSRWHRRHSFLIVSVRFDVQPMFVNYHARLQVVDRLVIKFGSWVLERISGWCGDNAAKTEIKTVMQEILQRGYVPRYRDPLNNSDDYHNQSLCWEHGSKASFGAEQGIGVRSFQQTLYLFAAVPRRIGRHHYKSLMTDVMGEIAGKAVTLNPIPQPTRWGTMGGCSTNLLKSEKLEYDDHPGKYLVPHGFMDLARGEKGVTRKMAIEFVSRVGDPRYRCAICFTSEMSEKIWAKRRLWCKAVSSNGFVYLRALCHHTRNSAVA